MLSYALLLADRYDGMVLATCPDVPEVVALGRDAEEAREEAQRALEATLGEYQAAGRPFPTAKARGTVQVSCERFGALEPA